MSQAIRLEEACPGPRALTALGNGSVIEEDPSRPSIDGERALGHASSTQTVHIPTDAAGLVHDSSPGRGAGSRLQLVEYRERRRFCIRGRGCFLPDSAPMVLPRDWRT